MTALTTAERRAVQQVTTAGEIIVDLDVDNASEVHQALAATSA